MPSQDAFYDLVADEWRRRGISLLPAAPDIEVVRLFADLGYPLSADVRSFYAVTGGFADGELDALWGLWSLDEVRKQNDFKWPTFVMFADYLLNSHAYCFHYENPEISSIYITHDWLSLERNPIAGSLAEFLEKLLCSPAEVQAWP